MKVDIFLFADEIAYHLNLYTTETPSFLTYETEFVLFLAVLENSDLPMGLDISHATFRVTPEFSILEVTSHTLPRKTPNDVHRRSSCDAKCHEYKK